MSESGSGGPVRRRRIAGETPPVPTTKKTSPITRGATKKVAAAKKSAPKKAAPVNRVASPVNKAASKKAVPLKKAASEQAVSKEAAARETAAKKLASKTPRNSSTATASPVPPPGAGPTAPAPVRPTRPLVQPDVRTKVVAPAGRPSQRDLLWLVPAMVVAVAVLALGGISAFSGVSDATSGGGGLASAQRAASSAAGSAAETIFSYRYDRLPEHLTESKVLMTPDFAKDFDKIAPALDEIAPQRQVQVEAVSRSAAALGCGDECSDTKVNVLVFLDQARLADGSKQPDVIGNRIKVTMVKSGSSWLVNDIRAL